jgi:hypothetical protein
MSDLDQNLKVVTDHLGELASKQQTAADKMTGANRAAADIAAKVENTHGMICWATSMAMSKAEAARHTAGSTMQKVSTELKQKLTTAATNYDNVDYREGRALGDACQV